MTSLGYETNRSVQIRALTDEIHYLEDRNQELNRDKVVLWSAVVVLLSLSFIFLILIGMQNEELYQYRATYGPIEETVYLPVVSEGNND